MKIYRIFALVLCVLCARAVSNAQAMETLAYSPLKKGAYQSYQYISTKSLTRLATGGSGVVNITGAFKANSSTLFLDTRSVTFGGPLQVRNGVFTRPNVSLTIGGNLNINGYFYANGSVNITGIANSAKVISSTNINAPQVTLRIPDGGKIYIDGIQLQKPGTGCTAVWKTVSGIDAAGTTLNNIKILGC
jgi:hypothetical protein